MDIAAGTINRIVATIGRSSATILLAAVALAVAMAVVGALIADVLIAGVLAPAPEPLISAPLRWFGKG